MTHRYEPPSKDAASLERIAYAAEFIANRLGDITARLQQLMEGLERPKEFNGSDPNLAKTNNEDVTPPVGSDPNAR